MEESTGSENASEIETVADIVAAYVSNNSVRPSDLPELIASVHAALAGLGAPSGPAVEQVEKPTPAQIRKSITPDGLISFVDGKAYKTLKRHLTKHGMDFRRLPGPVRAPVRLSLYSGKLLGPALRSCQEPRPWSAAGEGRSGAHVRLLREEGPGTAAQACRDGVSSPLHP